MNLSRVRIGVESRTAGIFREPGKAAMLLSGSRIDPAYGWSWVVLRLSAIALGMPRRSAPASRCGKLMLTFKASA